MRVRRIQTHSGQTGRGDLFVALRGSNDDGSHYIDEAVRRGAAAVCAQDSGPLLRGHPPGGPPPRGKRPARLVVQDTRTALARMAALYYGEPARRLDLFAVTGTNGKTTTACTLASILRAAGRCAGLIGTIGYKIGSEILGSGLTTPDPLTIHDLLAKMTSRGATDAVFEVSSHALDQKRVHGLEFKIAAFTNLSPEHLDYHGTLAHYLEAKKTLFAGLGRGSAAVLNRDDAVYAALRRACGAGQILSYSILDRDADLRAREISIEPDSMALELSTSWGDIEIRTALLGKHNLANICAAAAAALLAGAGPDAVVRGIESLGAVPGRLERVDGGRDFKVYIDYAHTPEALREVLRTLRPLTPGRIITVFGCGGDRDRLKRPQMAAAAAAGSNLAVVTSDNPRNEPVERILDEIVAGFDRGARWERVSDRDRAIAFALAQAKAGDTVLVAGKGHERTQAVAGSLRPFDDRMRILEHLNNG